LQGGIDTFSYVKNRPTLSVDPSGLFQLDPTEVWGETDSLPKFAKNGKEETVGGRTRGSIRFLDCTCEKSGNCWKLTGCHAYLLIDVQILSGTWGRNRSFLVHSEKQHVKDYRSGVATIQAAGQGAEDAIRQNSYSTKASCEDSARNAVGKAVSDALDAITKQTIATYDATGRHTWDASWWLGTKPFEDYE
jgi:hypothetical protein